MKKIKLPVVYIPTEALEEKEAEDEVRRLLGKENMAQGLDDPDAYNYPTMECTFYKIDLIMPDIARPEDFCLVHVSNDAFLVKKNISGLVGSEMCIRDR